VQQARQAGEQTKISIRNIRRDANKQLEKQEKDGEITEDDRDLAKKQIDDITKEFSEKADKIVTHKADEILKD
jgi:ribosome recycling factor